jgi:hypothetical protein
VNQRLPISAKMRCVTEDHQARASSDGIDERDQLSAIGRLNDLFVSGVLPVERFSLALEQVFGASTRADLETALVEMPPIVQLTPAGRRLTEPLKLSTPDGCLQLGSGWQLGTDTTVSTGFGSAQLDLTAASWDDQRVDLHLQTWGSIEVLVPRGAAVQLVGGSARARLEPLSSPVPGGPIVRISTAGPTGVVTIRHPRHPPDGRLVRRRRQRAARRAISER